LTQNLEKRLRQDCASNGGAVAALCFRAVGNLRNGDGSGRRWLPPFHDF